ncbi:hypothetical protein [Mucilaginibacter paludis]|uniref:Uncharacterized protein n=1 Tax=Mucilaginibacter paludis DSM 18603 TaxID=714943 RepID=H1Y410_9SPHI|nr:hypothetical protein [Mucilaginibacter paludis]EHQ30955.1 hypothetical protein Mucpa_6906 [Mucilaginibacter paludis DSM 18603]
MKDTSSKPLTWVPQSLSVEELLNRNLTIADFERNQDQYIEQIVMYSAVRPWASLTFWALVESSLFVEVLSPAPGVLGLLLSYLEIYTKCPWGIRPPFATCQPGKRKTHF